MLCRGQVMLLTYMFLSVKSSKLYPLIRWWVSEARTVRPSLKHHRHCTRTPSHESSRFPSKSWQTQETSGFIQYLGSLFALLSGPTVCSFNVNDCEWCWDMKQWAVQRRHYEFLSAQKWISPSVEYVTEDSSDDWWWWNDYWLQPPPPLSGVLCSKFIINLTLKV